MSDGVWLGWVNKEFTTTMKSKGKLDVTKSYGGDISLDKRNEAFNGVKRIFVNNELPIDKMKPPKTANPEKALLKGKLKAMANLLEEETLKRKELEAQLTALQNGGKGGGE